MTNSTIKPSDTYVITIIEYDSQSKRVVIVPKEIDLLTLHWFFRLPMIGNICTFSTTK